LHDLGEMGGSEFVTVLESEIPAHTHALRATNDPGDLVAPGPTRSLSGSTGGQLYAAANNPLVPMAFQALSPAGGSLPHNNMMPYLVLNFCIALQGVFPPRT
jgi:microcystin-dependent protein